MPRHQLTNQEIIRTVRHHQEEVHRRRQDYFFGFEPLDLPFSMPIPQVHLGHIQDSCNKSTAIYTITPRLEGHKGAYSEEKALRGDIIFTIYEQWFRNHNVDIDFGNFLAKLIRIEIPSNEQKPTIQVITKIHKAWCDHVEACLPLCVRKKDSRGMEIDDPYSEVHGAFGINRRQNMYFKLRPLFQALIMIVDTRSSESNVIVHLLRTAIPSKLSAPITFDDISPKLESDMFPHHEDIEIVTTTLSSAIDFITSLESREKAAFPESQRDPSVMDEQGAAPGYNTRYAKLLGYTGPDIRNSSSTWVKLAEGEDLLPPLTLIVTRKMTAAGMIDDPKFARYRRSNERDKYMLGTLGEPLSPKSNPLTAPHDVLDKDKETKAADPLEKQLEASV
ncbi:MAG: hypothetical protein Q9191_001174 [Dirinaria sp. TL-2023a]